jgi:cell fate regulator YaaT (PSP1 superfamily)
LFIDEISVIYMVYSGFCAYLGWDLKLIRATGIRFKRASKIYEYISAGLGEKSGDRVVVEAEKGEDLASVVYPEREIKVDEGVQFRKILRIATEKDLAAKRANILEEEKAIKVCSELVGKNELQLKLLLAEYSLDRSKLTFYYTSENRVDFRQLVKDLAKVYRTRIEMRQVGVRDATKVLGGFGVCGRELCCACFLRKFENISVKATKGQNTNPAKILGVCGRLMCCLLYEKGCCLPQEIAEETGISELVISNSDEERM